MSIKSLLAAALTVAACIGAQAAPHTLTLEAQGASYSAGLSTQAGSTVVTRTTAGAFRDEFLIEFDGTAEINAWLDTSAELSKWSNQGIVFTRAGFVGVDGSSLVFDEFQIEETLFIVGENLAPFVAQGNFLFFVEGIAGDPNVTQTEAQARLNSFSYSGGINIQPLADNDLPEPSGLLLAGLAMAGAVFSTRRRRAD